MEELFTKVLNVFLESVKNILRLPLDRQMLSMIS